MHVKSEV